MKTFSDYIAEQNVIHDDEHVDIESAVTANPNVLYAGIGRRKSPAVKFVDESDND